MAAESLQKRIRVRYRLGRLAASIKFLPAAECAPAMTGIAAASIISRVELAASSASGGVFFDSVQKDLRIRKTSLSRELRGM